MHPRFVIPLLLAGLAHAGFLAPRPASAQPGEGGKGGDAAGTPGAAPAGTVVPSHAAPPPEDVQRLKDQARQIQELIDALGSPNAGVRDAAARRLGELGPAAVPYLEEFLRKKGALEPARALGRLNDGIEAQPDPARVKDAQGRLPTSEQAARNIRSQAAAESYLYRKYNEAVGRYHLKEFDRAVALAQALLVLEPQSPFRLRLQELKMLCEREITRRQIVSATILPLKPEYRIGDEIDFRIRIENVSPAEVRMAFGAGASAPPASGDAATGPPGPMPAKVFVTMHDLLGLTRQVQRSVDWPMPTRIAIPPGGRWEQRVTVGSREDDETMDPSVVRTYEVELVFYPRFWAGENPEMRRIAFDTQPAVAFPAGARWRAADPLANLGAALDDKKTTLDELFMAAMRVSRADAEKGAALLVKSLPRFTGPAQDVVMVALRNLTGQSFGFDVAKWLEWGGVKVEPPRASAARPPPAPPDEASDEKRADLLNLVKLYLAARKEGDTEVLENVMRFAHEPERGAFRRCVKDDGFDADPVDLSKPVYIVQPPERGASGDYLLLVPLRGGYAPRRLILLDSKEGFRVAYTIDEFPTGEPDTSPALTALDAPPPERARACDRWKALQGAALERAAQAVRRKLEDDIQALDYARKNGLTVAPDLGSLEEKTKLWESLRGLPPERVREKLLAWSGAPRPVPPQ